MLGKQIKNFIFLGLLSTMCTQAQQESLGFFESLRQQYSNSAFYPEGSFSREQKSIDDALSNVRDRGDFGKRFSNWISTHSHPLTADVSINVLGKIPTDGRDAYQKFIIQLFEISKPFLAIKNPNREQKKHEDFSLFSFDRVVSSTGQIERENYNSFLTFYRNVLNNISPDAKIGSAGNGKADDLSWLVQGISQIAFEQYNTALLLQKALLPLEASPYVQGKFLKSFGKFQESKEDTTNILKNYIDISSPVLSASVINVFALLNPSQIIQFQSIVDNFLANKDYQEKREEKRNQFNGPEGDESRYSWSTEKEEKIFKSWLILGLHKHIDKIESFVAELQKDVVLYNDMLDVFNKKRV